MTNAQIKYINNPPPPKRVRNMNISLIIVGSKSKYSANPPHTPQSFLFVLERYNFFIAIYFLDLLHCANIRKNNFIVYLLSEIF